MKQQPNISDVYAAMLLELKPYENKIATLEAEIESWKTKCRQNILEGNCPRCNGFFRQGPTYPVCSSGWGCPSPCEYCLVLPVEGRTLCPCRVEIIKLYKDLADGFDEKSQTSKLNWK